MLQSIILSNNLFSVLVNLTCTGGVQGVGRRVCKTARVIAAAQQAANAFRGIG